LARVAPLLGVLFFVPAMNLAGIPPMSGFLGKVGLMDAGIRVGSPLAYALVAAGMVTSLLTLYAVAKTWNLAFWRTPEQAHQMALDLSDPGGARRPFAPPLVRHRDHIHVGATTFGSHDLDEARRIVDEGDGTDQDLHQLLAEDVLPSRLPRSMVGAAASLIVFGLGLTLVAGPLFGYTERAAQDMIDRDAYISSVLPGGVK
jgi:multicomponent Na+:H+ antiporter subunit D